MDKSIKKQWISSSIRNPLNEFIETEDTIEIRTDPLTGTTMRIGKSKGLDRIPKISPLAEFVSESKDCFFCENRLYDETPRFPQSLGVGDRISIGSAKLFPNLSGFSRYSGVCIFSTEHFLSLTGFTHALLQDAFEACQKYFEACWRNEGSRLYATINWNYLLPSGSSILHPHLQPVADPIPTNWLRMLWEASVRFYEEHEISYWDQLLKTEEKGPRFLGKSDLASWLTPFAPMGFNEIMGCIGDGRTILDLTRKDWSEITDMLIAIFGFYNASKHDSFNLILLSPPIDSRNRTEMPIVLRIATRPAFESYYRNDVTFYEKYHLETMLDQTSESVAENFRNWRHKNERQS